LTSSWFRYADLQLMLLLIVDKTTREIFMQSDIPAKLLSVTNWHDRRDTSVECPSDSHLKVNHEARKKRNGPERKEKKSG
jgi:hypothetical protein